MKKLEADWYGLKQKISNTLMNFGFQGYISVADINGNTKYIDSELVPYEDVIESSIKINQAHFNIGDYCIPISSKNLMIFKISEKGMVTLFANKGNIAHLLSFKEKMNFYDEQIDNLIEDLEIPSTIPKAPPTLEKREVKKKVAKQILGKELPIYNPVLNEEISGKYKATVEELDILQLCDGFYSLSDLQRITRYSEEFLFGFLSNQIKKKKILPESYPLVIECPECKSKHYIIIPESVFREVEEPFKILIRSEKCNHEYIASINKKLKIETQSFKYFTDFQKDKFMKRLGEHYYSIIQEEEIFEEEMEEPEILKEEIAIPEEEIIIKRAYDYFSGNIRFKIVIENNSDEIIRDVMATLNVKEQFEINTPSNKITIIDPEESSSMDFILNPLKCGKSKIYGTVSYINAKGEPFSRALNPLLIHVKCPLVLPKRVNYIDTINLKETTDKSQSQIKYSNISTSKTFQIASEQISALDLTEFEKNEERFHALYSGVAKISGDPILVELKVGSDIIVVNVYTKDMIQGTGLLAYLKNLIEVSLKYSSQMVTTLDKISTQIFRAYEFSLLLSKLYESCESKNPMTDLILLLNELKIEASLYFSDLDLTKSYNNWINELESIKDKKIYDRTYLNLQFDLLKWMEEIIFLSETNSKIYYESPTTDVDICNEIGMRIFKLKQDQISKSKAYARKILFALMINYKQSGINLYNYDFTGETLEHDLVSGFLTAIQRFGSTISKRETTMKKLSYRHFEIEIEEDEFTVTALITLGYPNRVIINKLKEFVNKFEKQHKKELHDFSGNVTLFEDTKKLLKKYFN
ncbi:MAG: hypothetical protein HWN65_12600 [Candidatus Helarchaeota archaeon]|nr:hypothetical protein [Candidatus Helarchaeota archaeon]